MESGLSVADLLQATGGNRNDGLFGGNGSGFIVLILFLLLMGGNGWGGNNANAQNFTRAEMYEGFNNQEITGKLDGITNGLCSGFYNANTTMLNGFNSIGSQIADSRYAMQNCCCETNRNIDALKYTSAQNTCDIITASNANTQRILDSLCQDRIQSLRDKVAEKDQMLQTANFQLSQQAQTTNIVQQLQPTPRPAYITASPYQAQMYAWNNYGTCGC
jgi:hypothetical protein